MITNKPRPPKFLCSHTNLSTSLDVYTYFANEQHGLDLFDVSVAGEFQTAVELISVSGVLEYLILAVDRTTSGGQRFGARVVIDGATVFNDTSRSVPSNAETGVNLFGIMFWNDTDNEPYCSDQDRAIFEHDLKIEAWMQTTTSMDMLVAYRYRLTGLTGS